MRDTAAQPGGGAFKAGRAVVPLLALAIFINYVDRGTLGTAGPLMKDELHLSGAQFGALTSAFFWAYVPAQPLAGWVAERFNTYRVLAFGLALWAAATVATGTAAGFAEVLGLRLALGIGESVAIPCAAKLVARHTPGHRLGAANGIISLGLALGPAFGVFFGGLLMARFGWRDLFLLLGGISLVWLLPWIFTVRGLEDPAERRVRAGAPSLAAILRRRELWGLSLSQLAANYGLYFVIAWLPLYLVKAQGFSVAGMAAVGGSIYLTYAAAALVSGLAADRWMAAGATASRARKTIGVLGSTVGAAGLLACAVADRPIALASLFVIAAALGSLAPHILATGQTLAGPRATGKWTGLQNCIGNLSGVAGPVVTGFIIDRTGGYPAAFALAAAVTLSGVLGWLVLIPKIAPLPWAAEAEAQRA